MKYVIYIGVCLIAFSYPFFHDSGTGHTSHQDYEFITTFQGSELVRLEMGESESGFYDSFPGRTGYFRIDGHPGESIFVRYTEKPTRMLHSVEGCYRAGGYDVEFTDNVMLKVPEVSPEVLQWSQFRVIEEGRRYLVRQCILSLSANEHYSDVPAWYWQTMFSSKDKGPWLAITWKLRDPTAK